MLTGLRRGEVCGLQWEDIQNNVLHVKRSISSTQKTTQGKNENARRYIVLTGLMQSEIDEQRALLKKNGIISPWIFPSPAGSVINTNNLYNQWQSYREQHGIESSIHELRHTMISIVKTDIPETLLKQVVGHSKAMDTGDIPARGRRRCRKGVNPDQRRVFIEYSIHKVLKIIFWTCRVHRICFTYQYPDRLMLAGVLARNAYVLIVLSFYRKALRFRFHSFQKHRFVGFIQIIR